jgi:glycosyltransferase involved in cell wall biosynthesis
VIQLIRSLESVPEIQVVMFSWRAALFGKYDVFHVHWPENLLQGRSRARGYARSAFTLLVLLRARVSKIPIVRTQHNLNPPRGLSALDYRILRLIDKSTTLTIRLNGQTPITRVKATETIPHGHYRDWFAEHVKAKSVAGRLAYFGLIRRYKNVAHLVSIARTLPATFSLTVSGMPSTPELSTQIEKARETDRRITLDFHFLTDAELVHVVTESELVVLPYSEMHNSGSVLAALSLGRPVLVPDTAVNRALAAEVGAGWLYLYDGELDSDHILSAYLSMTEHPPTAQPDLRSREWDDSGKRHVAAYKRAIRIVRG